MVGSYLTPRGGKTIKTSVMVPHNAAFVFEGQAVASILEAKRKAIETVDLEARLSALEKERK